MREFSFPVKYMALHLPSHTYLHSFVSHKGNVDVTSYELMVFGSRQEGKDRLLKYTKQLQENKHFNQRFKDNGLCFCVKPYEPFDLAAAKQSGATVAAFNSEQEVYIPMSDFLLVPILEFKKKIHTEVQKKYKVKHIPSQTFLLCVDRKDNIEEMCFDNKARAGKGIQKYTEQPQEFYKGSCLCLESDFIDSRPKGPCAVMAIQERIANGTNWTKSDFEYVEIEEE
jgi:hypothetical protein